MAEIRARVVVADDDVLLREGLSSLLTGSGFEVLGRAGDPTQLLALVRQHRPDLVIVDIRMPPTHTTKGLDAAQLIRREFPETAILVLSAHAEVEQATELLASGHRSGYLLKSRISDVEDFLATLDRIVKGASAWIHRPSSRRSVVDLRFGGCGSGRGPTVNRVPRSPAAATPSTSRPARVRGASNLREIGRGIHPTILSRGGLELALKALARSSAVPVELDVRIATRPPAPIEIAAYYLVTEALRNAGKHAEASRVRVEARIRDDRLDIAVTDDGVGGADPAGGTGLLGLIDRINALGGRIAITSPRGAGTKVGVELPLDDGPAASAVPG